jgi:hypothetical protein
VSGKKSAASSWARIRASTLSVFTLASAIARVLRGFDTTTRRTSGRSDRRDRIGARRRLQRDLVIACEADGPRPQVFWSPDPSLVAAQALLDDGDLGERAVHIHPDRSHAGSFQLDSRNPPGGDDRNGLALAAQSGQSQGRPSTNATSQVNVYSGLP